VTEVDENDRFLTASEF